MTSILLPELALAFGIGRSTLARLITTAPERYKIYQIPKRRGGTRIIAQPSQELKELQRAFVRTYAALFPVHTAATAYIKNKNIRDNASSHVGSRVIAKLDFKNFFNSIKSKHWIKFLERQDFRWNNEHDIELSCRILFWRSSPEAELCLSVGAPSSPHISNILLYDLDAACQAQAALHSVTYTRYADDITLSGESREQIEFVTSWVIENVNKFSEFGLQINFEKFGVYTKGQRQMVTGLIITPDRQISIGRERKRLLSAMVHAFQCGRLRSEDVVRLRGFLAFAYSIEPAFVERLRSKYGDQVLTQLGFAR